MQQTNYVACGVRLAGLRSDRARSHLAVTVASNSPYNLTRNKPDKSWTIYLQITNTQRNTPLDIRFFYYFLKKYQNYPRRNRYAKHRVVGITKKVLLQIGPQN